MRVPRLVSDFFEWRWAPCVGLTAGSLAFVALALVLIPTRFGGEPHSVSSYAESPQPRRAIFSSALARSAVESDEGLDEGRVAHPTPTPVAQRTDRGVPLQRGFSPILERPEPLPTTPPAVTVEASTPAPAGPVVVPPAAGGESHGGSVQ